MPPAASGGDTAAGAPVRRRVLIIVNPAAGRSHSSRRRLARTVAALQQRGCSAAVRWAGPQAGEVERLTREAEPEFAAIVAAGGDGTVNAVLNGLAAAPRPLAVLPLGTANVLAREIGLPRRCGDLARVIADGPARPVWPGKAGDRLFLLMASAGFDAAVVARVSPRLKRLLGRLAFVAAMVGCLWRYRGSELAVRIDGIERRATTVIVARSRRYAGPFVIAPDADLAERALDAVLFLRAGRLAAVRYLAALLRGRLPHRRDVAILRCRRLHIAAPEPFPVQADGEIVASLPVSVSLADRPVPLIVPS